MKRGEWIVLGVLIAGIVLILRAVRSSSAGPFISTGGNTLGRVTYSDGRVVDDPFFGPDADPFLGLYDRDGGWA